MRLKFTAAEAANAKLKYPGDIEAYLRLDSRIEDVGVAVDDNTATVEVSIKLKPTEALWCVLLAGRLHKLRGSVYLALRSALPDEVKVKIAFVL